MTRTEIITRLCEMVADITNIRENELKDEDWMVDASLREVTIRIQLALKKMQEKGEKK